MQAYLKLITENLNTVCKQAKFMVWDSEKKQLIREIESFAVNGDTIQCNMAPVNRTTSGRFQCHMFDGCNGIQYCILWDGKHYRILDEDDQGNGHDLTSSLAPISTDVELCNAARLLSKVNVIDSFVAEQILTYAGE